jgi:hypothetical protein
MYRKDRRRTERQLARRSAGPAYRSDVAALGAAGVIFLLGLLIALKSVLG